MKLTHEEVTRYSRHLTLPEVGMEGQLKFKGSKVLLIGAGGLGCPLGLYLGAAGIGKLGIVDFDVVDFSNLQRQIAHTTADVGKPKVQSIKEAILACNPTIEVETYDMRLSQENVLDLFSQYDVIVDGSDNFETRYLVNDAAYFAKKPLVYGSIFRFQGQMTVFDPHRGGPCYRCIYASPPPVELVPNCAEGGVLGVLPGTVGLIQATEALKLVLGTGKTLRGRLLLFDAMRMSFKEVKLQPDPECALCGQHATIKELKAIDYHAFCEVAMPSAPKAEATPQPGEFNEADYLITAPELEEVLNEGTAINLIDVREPHEWEICHLEGARLIPLATIEKAMSEIDRQRPTYLYCYKGKRSMTALKKLHQAGFTQLKNLEGGIDRWAEMVDPAMPRY